MKKLIISLSIVLLSTPAYSQGNSGNNGVKERVTVLEAQIVALQAQVDEQAHARYADAEAVTAVGPHFSGDHAALTNVQSGQHHVGYTDANAVAAAGPHFSGDHTALTNVQSGQHHDPTTSVLDPYVTVVPGGLTGMSGPNIVFDGANIHIRGDVDASHHTDGTGNLIIGLNEPPIGYTESEVALARVGSHNLVIGPEHIFPNAGAVVAGIGNIGHRFQITPGVSEFTFGNVDENGLPTDSDDNSDYALFERETLADRVIYSFWLYRMGRTPENRPKCIVTGEFDRLYTYDILGSGKGGNAYKIERSIAVRFDERVNYWALHVHSSEYFLDPDPFLYPVRAPFTFACFESI